MYLTPNLIFFFIAIFVYFFHYLSLWISCKSIARLGLRHYPTSIFLYPIFSPYQTLAFSGTLVRRLHIVVTPNQDLLQGVCLTRGLGLLHLGIGQDLDLEVGTGLFFLVFDFKFMRCVFFFLFDIFFSLPEFDYRDIVNVGNTLYVTGLSSRVTERDLEHHFSKEGKVFRFYIFCFSNSTIIIGTNPWFSFGRLWDVTWLLNHVHALLVALHLWIWTL